MGAQCSSVSVVTVTLLCLLSPERGICTLLFPWGPICVCQQCPETSLAKQEGTSCVIWGCLIVVGYRWQKEISKRSRLLTYPLPEDKGINCYCPKKLIYPFPAQLTCEEDEYRVSTGMARGRESPSAQHSFLTPSLVPAFPIL